MPRIDAAPEDLRTVLHILRTQVPECEVWAFGSRVTQAARKFSDLDLAIMTSQPLDTLRLAALKDAFSESPLPFRVDVIDWASVSEAFQAIIRRDYMVLQKPSQ